LNNKANNNTQTIFNVKRYASKDKNSWDAFVKQAKNATFLFNRNYMDYHQDRFNDYSLLIFKGDTLVGVLPANRVDNVVYSHQGLTYGGLVLDKKMKLQEAIGIFKALLSFLNSEEIKTLQLKLLPKIYSILPSDELDYAMFLTKAKLIRTDVSSTIDYNNKIKIQSNRVEGVKKAKKLGLTIEEGNDFKSFWNQILIPNLQERHQAAPVHSLSEIEQLAEKFKKQIVQYNVLKDGEIVAGATLYETSTVAHVQYISANADKQQLGSLDFLFEYLINTRYVDKRYFDFGISNQNQGKNINEGLLYWKECFGARSVVHQFYKVKTSNFTMLDSVFI